MVLGFLSTFRHSSNDVAAKPTYFIAKIWRGLLHGVQVNAGELIDLMDKLTPEQKELINTVKPKLHTFRQDVRDEWQPGIEIEMVDDHKVRFLPIVKCTGTQKIEMVWTTSIGNFGVWIDGKRLPDYKIETLATNDGFDCLEDFYAFFPTGYKGKIIHWTDLRY